MRLVPRAALALAAAIPLTLARAEDAASAPRHTPSAAASARKKEAGERSATAAVPATANGAGQTTFTPAGSNAPATEALPWSSPPGGFDGDGPVEVVRTGRCGG